MVNFKLFTLFKAIVHKKNHGFSLIEVVLALGIGVFAMVSIMGLMTAGLKNNTENESEIEAANMATMLINARRILPWDRHALVFPALKEISPGLEYKDSVMIGYDGMESKNQGIFKLRYSIKREEKRKNLYWLYMNISWPPSPGEKSPKLHDYEIITTVRIPPSSQ